MSRLSYSTVPRRPPSLPWRARASWRCASVIRPSRINISPSFIPTRPYHLCATGLVVRRALVVCLLAACGGEEKKEPPPPADAVAALPEIEPPPPPPAIPDFPEG